MSKNHSDVTVRDHFRRARVFYAESQRDFAKRLGGIAVTTLTKIEKGLPTRGGDPMSMLETKCPEYFLQMEMDFKNE